MGQQVTLRVQCRSAVTYPRHIGPSVLLSITNSVLSWSVTAGKAVRRFGIVAGDRRSSSFERSRQASERARGLGISVCLRIQPQRSPQPVGPPHPLDSSVRDIFWLWGDVRRHGSGSARVAEPWSRGPLGNRSTRRRLRDWVRWHLPGQDFHRPPRRQDHAGIPSLTRCRWRRPRLLVIKSGREFLGNSAIAPPSDKIQDSCFATSPPESLTGRRS